APIRPSDDRATGLWRGGCKSLIAFENTRGVTVHVAICSSGYVANSSAASGYLPCRFVVCTRTPVSQNSAIVKFSHTDRCHARFLTSSRRTNLGTRAENSTGL